MIDWFTHQFQNNEVFSGIVGAGLISSVVFLVRGIPRKIYNWVTDKFGTRFTINSKAPIYIECVQFFAAAGFFDSRRRYHLYGCTDSWGGRSKGNLYIGPAAGTYYKTYKGRFCRIVLTIEKNDNGGWEESLSFYGFGIGQKITTEIIDSIDSLKESGGEKWLYIYTHNWARREMPKRSLDAIFLNPDSRARILEGLGSLKKTRQLADKAPHLVNRFSFCFYGKPGTGKTSLCYALAAELDYHLYFLNLNNFGSDQYFIDAWTHIQPNSVIVFDDIDAQNNSLSRGEEKSKGVSLSCILSALDGPLALKDCVVIINTNNRESLDPALVRAGRVNCEVALNGINREVALDMVEYLTGERNDALLGAGEEFAASEIEQRCLSAISK